jgi:sulfatase modifying factor 1
MVDEVLASIPEGWFLMGSEEGQDDERPVHRVWVDSFDLSVYPVTEAQYARFLDATGHESPREWAPSTGGPDLPVIGVSWHDAQAYCAWRTQEGEPRRLPTEAEWERAARGGIEGARYPWGDAIPEWIPDDGRGPRPSPWSVTLGVPNAYGLYGISANVHEWCEDWYGARFYDTSPERSPAGPAHGARRASRGGSWRHAVTISRSAARSRLDPSFRYTDYGFRVATRSAIRNAAFGINTGFAVQMSEGQVRVRQARTGHSEFTKSEFRPDSEFRTPDSELYMLPRAAKDFS